MKFYPNKTELNLQIEDAQIQHCANDKYTVAVVVAKNKPRARSSHYGYCFYLTTDLPTIGSVEQLRDGSVRRVEYLCQDETPERKSKRKARRDFRIFFERLESIRKGDPKTRNDMLTYALRRKMTRRGWKFFDSNTGMDFWKGGVMAWVDMNYLHFVDFTKSGKHIEHKIKILT